MTRRIVAVDCGTTATKAWVVADGQVVSAERAIGGVRDVARNDGRGRDWLRDHVRSVAEAALTDADVSWSGLDAVVAFGMITSELGLMEVPHLPAPAGVDDLAQGLRDAARETLPAVLRYVPGVIYHGDGEATATDFMRGEETEVAGLMTMGDVSLPLLYVSPGSHTKFVLIDRDRRIRWSFTTLTGELLWALSQETILAGLVDPSEPHIITEAVDRGAETSSEYGLSRALYTARLISRVEGASDPFCSSFVLGAVASCDIAALRAARRDGIDLPGSVRIADGPPMSAVYDHLIGREPWASEVRAVHEPLGALGAWALHRAREELPSGRQPELQDDALGASGGS